MAAKNVELRPDRDLLHTNFDGYRLSLDPVPVLKDEHKSHQLPNRDYPNLETQYSFLHQELFGHQNLLVSDPWIPNSVFYVTNAGAIENVRYENQITRSRKMFTLPVNRLRPAGAYNYSMQFISKELLVVCDGVGQLWLIKTGDRSTRNESAWEITHGSTVLENDGLVIKDARADLLGDRTVVNVLLLQIIQDPDCSEKFMTKLIWIRLKENGDANWNKEATKVLHAKKTVIPYCSLTKGGTGFIVATQKTFRFISDTEKEVEQPETGEKKKVDYKAFSWTQTTEDVVVNFSALEDSSKSDFYVQCTTTAIVVKFKEITLIDGELCGKIDPDLTTWQLQNDTLQVTMVKAHEGQLWEEIIPGGPAEAKDSEGAGPEVAESFTSVPNLTASLEECDRDDGEYYLEQVDAGTHKVSHRVYLGSNAPLFNKQLEQGRVVALRHDVDTCLWAFKGDAEQWKHLGTLDAFGYVAASKQQRKFLDCSPDMNYSVICEPERHVFIYMNEYAAAGGLRNRNGNQIRVGQQRLVALDGTGEVLGISVQNEMTFLLTQKFVLCLKVQG